MKKKSIFSGAGLLAFSMVIAKLLGALYRIPLTNVVGGEGIGLYQMVFPLYTLLLTLSSGGFPVAISRLVAVCLASGDEAGAKKILKVCSVTLFALGLLGTVLLLAFSSFLATAQGNPSAKQAYIGIAPAVVLVAVLSCFRGYYQGKENMLPSALSQLIEQAGKLLIGLTLATVMVKKGVAYGVLGALLGVSLSEALSVIFILCYHAIGTKRIKNRSLRATDFAGDMTAELSMPVSLQSSCKKRGVRIPKGTLGILKGVFSVALPVTFGALVIPLTQVVDSVLIINVLSSLGYSATESTMAYGLVSGTVMTLVNVPVVVISAFSMTLLPKIAKVCAHPSQVKREATLGVKICLLLGFVAFLLMFTYSGELVSLLYSRGLNAYQLRLASRLLRINSLAIFYLSIVQVSTAVLQGLNKAKIPAINLAVGGVVKIAITALTLPLFGIYGAVIGSVSCYAVTALLDVIKVRKHASLSLYGAPYQALPIAGAMFLLVAFLVMELISGFLGVVISCVLATSSYILVSLLLKWLTGDELRRLLPFFRSKDGQERKNC